VTVDISTKCPKDELAPFVSVIIPVWNSPELIQKCLRAVTAQTYPADRFEVLVVDNASTDATVAAIAAFPRVTLLSEPQPGSYHARNAGLGAARGAYVAFTDADCIPAENWLEVGISAAQSAPGVGIVTGRIDLFRDGEGSSDACEMYERVFAFNQEKNVRYGHCFTANWISPRHLLASLGGFDGALKSGGDFAMSRRLRDLGHGILYAPEMVVRHPVRADLGELARKRRRVIGGRWSATKQRWAILRWIYICLREAGGKGRVLVFESHLSFPDKLRVGGVLISLTCVTLAELIHLALGGAARRA
jgi:glycosyltransferase involved in cell wall biosynthesis